MTKSKQAFAAIAIVLSGAVIWWMKSPPAPVFPDLQGPDHITTVASPIPTLFTDYPGSGPHSVAIWVNDPASSWLGLALGFKSIGLPFRLVTSIEQALEHNVIMVYPSLTGGNTSPDALISLREHVQGGGTLVGFSVLGGGMSSLFGFTGSEEHRERQRLDFHDQPITDGLIDATAARQHRLAASGSSTTGLPGTHYTGFSQAIATFEDGTAAMTYRGPSANSEDEFAGHAYAIGLDLGHFTMRAFNGRFSNLADTYVNAFQPQVDTWLRLMARIYQQGEPNAVTLSPTPQGRDFTALMTYDVDFTHSINNIPVYVELHQREAVPATFFIQTKYITDYNDRRFFDPSRQATLDLVLDNNMEVASHTVAHSNEFSRMPIGTGDEQYPQYRPFVRAFDVAENATMMGELRVSKFLLQSLSGAEVKSFRPGHLSRPDALPQLLVANNYRFSSSMTANEAMSHLPFQLTYHRGYASQVNAFEFPVTVEDESGNLLQRFEEITALSKQIAQYHGLVTLMVHTDSLGDKLEFVSRYLDYFEDRAWFDTMSNYGSWWAARTSVVTDIMRSTHDTVQLQVSTEHPIDGLTLQIPERWHYERGLDGTSQSGTQLVLGEFEDSVTLHFSKVD